MKFKLIEDFDSGPENGSAIGVLDENNNDGKNRILTKVRDLYKLDIPLKDLKKMGAIHHIDGGHENISIANSGLLALIELNLHDAIHKYSSGFIALQDIVHGNKLNKSTILHDLFTEEIERICTKVNIADNNSIFIQNSILDKLGVNT